MAIAPRAKDKTPIWFGFVHILVPVALIIWGIEWNMGTLVDLGNGTLFSAIDPVFSVLGLRFFNPVLYLAIFARGLGEPELMQVFQETGLPGFILIVSSVFILIVMSLIRTLQNKSQFFGTARYATLSELRNIGLLNDKGVVLGQTAEAKIKPVPPPRNSGKDISYKVLKTGRFIASNGNTNCLLFAPTRSGKGVGSVIPSLVLWDGSAIIFDPKAENWDKTAGFRREFSHVLRFDPTKKGFARYNPYFDIREGDNAFRDASNHAKIMLEREGGKSGGDGTSEHFDEIARDAYTGITLYMTFSWDVPLEDKNINGALKFMSSFGVSGDDQSTSDGSGIIEAMKYGNFDDPMIAGFVERIANRMSMRPDRERGSMFSTIFRALGMYEDPLLALNTATSDFTIKDLMESETPISLYITIPYSDIDRLKNLVRAFVTMIVERIAEKETGYGNKAVRNHILFLLDEFPMLGRFHVLEKSMGVVAGMGMTFFLIAQSLNQLAELYGQNHPFFDHCKTWATYAPGDYKTAELVSKIAGIESVNKASISNSGSRMDLGMKNVSTSFQDTQRNLINADEVMAMGPDDVLVFAQGMRPYPAKKNFYYSDKRFTGLVGRKTPEAGADAAKEYEGLASGRGEAPWSYLQKPKPTSSHRRGLTMISDEQMEENARQHEMMMQYQRTTMAAHFSDPDVPFDESEQQGTLDRAGKPPVPTFNKDGGESGGGTPA